MKLKLPNTFVLLFALLALIALSTWFVPGGQYDTQMVNGKKVIDPDSFRTVASNPQGLVALLTAPLKGCVEAALIIGFVLIVGGVFNVLHKTEAIDAMIKRLPATDPITEARKIKLRTDAVIDALIFKLEPSSD